MSESNVITCDTHRISYPDRGYCPKCAAEQAVSVEKLSLEDGKYTFRMDNHSLYCDCYGEPWREFVGDKAISALFQHAQSMHMAIEDALIVAHIFDAKRHADTSVALQDLINWHVTIALDPKVSSDAQALIDLGAASERSL